MDIWYMGISMGSPWDGIHYTSFSDLVIRTPSLILDKNENITLKGWMH